MNIENVKKAVLKKYPFFGSIIASVSYTSISSDDIAYTDGVGIYYNEEKMSAFSESKQQFVIAHEICHIALDHINRSKGKDQMLWNIATDAVTNQLLLKDGMTIVDNAINIPQAILYDAETLYEKLLEEANENPEKYKQIKDRYDNGKLSHSPHKNWNNHINENIPSPIKQAQREMAKMGEQKAIGQNNEETKTKYDAQEKEIAVQLTDVVANTTSSENINLNNIGTAKQLINWKRLLRDYIMARIDWSFKEMTIENGVILPKIEYEIIPKTEILLDTSGSISHEDLKSFIRECKHILRESSIEVGCFDTKFYGFNKIKKLSDIDNIKLVGGGGTNFEVAITSFSKGDTNRVIFTDGYAVMPRDVPDIIWVVFGDKKINPNRGVVIHVAKDELKKSNFVRTRKV